jgi:hypothetical protein
VPAPLVDGVVRWVYSGHVAEELLEVTAVAPAATGAAEVAITLETPAGPIYAGTVLATIAQFTAVDPQTGLAKPIDPDVTTLRFRTGRDNPWATATIQHLGVGLFKALIPTTPGDGIIEWAGAGAAAVTGIARFKVSRVPT